MLGGNIDWNAIQSKIHLVLPSFFFSLLTSCAFIVCIEKGGRYKMKKLAVILVTAIAVGVFAEHSLLIYFPTIVYTINRCTSSKMNVYYTVGVGKERSWQCIFAQFITQSITWHFFNMKFCTSSLLKPKKLTSCGKQSLSFS